MQCAVDSNNDLCNQGFMVSCTMSQAAFKMTPSLQIHLSNRILSPCHKLYTAAASNKLMP